jgi:hypothetical protein
MAAHRQVDGIYQWELSIPPASAAALLSAVCVDLDDPNSHYVGHLLLGPKTWEVHFHGNEFELRPLGAGKYHLIYGSVTGRIIDAKGGSRLELRLATIARYNVIFAIVAVPVSLGWTVMLFHLLADYALWIRICASAAAIGWFAFGFLWLIPREPLWRHLGFFDDLFADYIVPPVAEQKPTVTAKVAAPAK